MSKKRKLEEAQESIELSEEEAMEDVDNSCQGKGEETQESIETVHEEEEEVEKCKECKAVKDLK